MRRIHNTGAEQEEETVNLDKTGQCLIQVVQLSNPALAVGVAVKKSNSKQVVSTDKGGWDVLLTKTAHFNIYKI